LAAALSVRATAVERLGPPPDAATPWGSTAEWQPPVPRTKVQPPPEGAAALARVAQLTGSLAGAASTQALAVSPEEASRHILAAWERSGGRVPEGVASAGADAQGSAPVAPVAGAANDHDER
jgi:electron transfer flavoprotein beta subunit